MELVHYAEQPVVFDWDRTYVQEEPHAYLKPHGLWVSVTGEDDWAAWCRDAEFRLGELEHAYRVTLAADANVLVIDSGEGILRFHADYSVETEFVLRVRDWASEEFVLRQRPIDWRKVAADYDGLIIAPYQWSLRLMGPAWYYGWDCASGCVWSTGAIAEFREEE